MAHGVFRGRCWLPTYPLEPDAETLADEGRQRDGRRAIGTGLGASLMDYDAELRLLNEVLRRAYGVERHDHVLDIGCGAGQTTREAARLATEGGALGVDVSKDAITRARDLARAEGIRNVTFEHADAQVHPFHSLRFDLAISRFGTMFFVDSVAAFANIGRALQPDGRLVMMVWQGHELNEWSLAIEESLGGSSYAPASEAPDPFSLADSGGLRESSTLRASRTSPSPTSTSPSTSVGTSPPGSSGSAVSRARRKCLRVWAAHRSSGRSGASKRRSRRTRAPTASGSTREPGS